MGSGYQTTSVCQIATVWDGGVCVCVCVCVCVDIEEVAWQLIQSWMNASDSLWLGSEAVSGGLIA